MAFIGSALISALEIYTFIIFIYVLMSWVPTSTGLISDIYAGLGRICEPYLKLFRKFIPALGGMVDITPILAIIVLQLAGKLIATAML